MGLTRVLLEDEAKKAAKLEELREAAGIEEAVRLGNVETVARITAEAMERVRRENEPPWWQREGIVAAVVASVLTAILTWLVG